MRPLRFTFVTGDIPAFLAHVICCQGTTQRAHIVLTEVCCDAGLQDKDFPRVRERH